MIDDNQDKHGNHQMPRMMSHMAIGIGAAARSGFNEYKAPDYNSLTFTSGATGTPVASRKRAADSSIYDRMLQDERGQRVQLMKDTTKASDYVAQELNFTQSGSTQMYQTISGGKSILIFQTGSDSGLTLEKLRTGLEVQEAAATSGALAAVGNSPILTIESIESGSSAASPSITSSETKITFSAAITATAAQPATSAATVVLKVAYVNAKTLTTYTNASPHPTHSATLELSLIHI